MAQAANAPFLRFNLAPNCGHRPRKQGLLLVQAIPIFISFAINFIKRIVCFAKAVRYLDDGLVFEGVHLENDAAFRSVRGFTADHFLQAGTHGYGGNEKAAEIGFVGIAG